MATKSKVPNLEERIKIFSTQVTEKAKDVYPDGLVVDFLDYWTEHNEGARKFRKEMVKGGIFNIGRRLGTWNRLSNGKYKTKVKTNELEEFRRQQGL